jgi:hypothetical protein
VSVTFAFATPEWYTSKERHGDIERKQGEVELRELHPAEKGGEESKST